MQNGFDFSRSLNQPPVLENYNAFTTHKALRNALNAYGGSHFNEQAEIFGQLTGSHVMQEAGRLANTYTPILHTHDRFGNRADEVEFHPAYHQLMDAAIRQQVHSIAWTNGNYVAHAALSYLKQQVDEGTSCPLTMTFAVVPSLRMEPAVEEEWLPLVLSNEYDARNVPYAVKKGCTFGMAMTEPQGGSDVRANITYATPLNKHIYRITGRKWFCSAPMSDAFLVLAQTEKGLSCFLVPRFTPEGEKNTIHFQRLKDKLGNRSNASSEAEFHNAWGRLIGEEGRGVANIMEMVRHTRLDCAIGSAATLQRAVAEAVHHCHYRDAFGKPLIAQPLMRNVLADLCLESEAATVLAFRLAKGFDDAAGDEAAGYFNRIATAVGKYWNTKRAVQAVGEAMECIGGNGYVEASILPRLYRDVPVNAIWEGSGNIQALDVLRAMQKEPRVTEAVMQYLEKARGMEGALDAHIARLQQLLHKPEEQAFAARIITEHLALAMQAIELIHVAPPAVAQCFCETRLSGQRGLMWGALQQEQLAGEIIHRVFEPAE